MPSASSMACRAARSWPSAPPPAPAVSSWTCSSRVKSFSWCERMASSFSSSSCSPGFSARALISCTANDSRSIRRRRSRSSLASFDRRSRSVASERYSSWKCPASASVPPCRSRSRRCCSRSSRLWCSCCPCTSNSSDENSARSVRVTGVDWMNEAPLPVAFSTRRRMTAPSSGSIPRAASHAAASPAPATPTTPETAVSSAPALTIEVSVRSPSRRPRAPIRIDFPAPVSPVSTFRPPVKRTCSFSMMA